MFINNGAWVLLWVFFFTRFPVLRGWSLEKSVVSLWAISAAGYGITYSVMGNAHRQLASAITELENYGGGYLAFVRPDVRHMAMLRGADPDGRDGVRRTRHHRRQPGLALWVMPAPYRINGGMR